MKFLIDNGLSPDLADLLAAAGHDAVHVRTLGLQSAADALIFHTALEQQRVLVSADTDFGALLTLGQRDQPSVILLRPGSPRRPDQQSQMLLANLDNLAIDLERGAIVVFPPEQHSGTSDVEEDGGGQPANACASAAKARTTGALSSASLPRLRRLQALVGRTRPRSQPPLERLRALARR